VSQDMPNRALAHIQVFEGRRHKAPQIVQGCLLRQFRRLLKARKELALSDTLLADLLPLSAPRPLKVAWLNRRAGLR
jgi:hypothetical protein